MPFGGPPTFNRRGSPTDMPDLGGFSDLIQQLPAVEKEDVNRPGLLTSLATMLITSIGAGLQGDPSAGIAALNQRFAQADEAEQRNLEAARQRLRDIMGIKLKGIEAKAGTAAREDEQAFRRQERLDKQKFTLERINKEFENALEIAREEARLRAPRLGAVGEHVFARTDELLADLKMHHKTLATALSGRASLEKLTEIRDSIKFDLIEVQAKAQGLEALAGKKSTEGYRSLKGSVDVLLKQLEARIKQLEAEEKDREAKRAQLRTEQKATLTRRARGPFTRLQGAGRK